MILTQAVLTWSIKMNNLIVNLENLTEQERELLTSLIQKAQTSKLNLLEPNINNGESYLYINAQGEVETDTWRSDNFDLGLFIYGNVFKDTPENIAMLEAKAKQQKAIVEVNRRVQMLIAEQHPGWKLDWTNKIQTKYYPIYDTATSEIKEINTLTFSHISQFTFEHAPKGIYEQIDKTLLLTAMGVKSWNAN